jgi:hypothetical protein
MTRRMRRWENLGGQGWEWTPNAALVRPSASWSHGERDVPITCGLSNAVGASIEDQHPGTLC